MKQDIRRFVRSGKESDVVNGEIIKLLSHDGNVRRIELNGNIFTVRGTNRLQVLEGDVSRPTLRKCKCGEEFEISKFTPYYVKCEKCRKKKKEYMSDRMKKTCSVCRLEFETSKYTHYITVCKECKKKEESEGHRDEKINLAIKYAAKWGYYGSSEEEIKSLLEKEYDSGNTKYVQMAVSVKKFLHKSFTKATQKLQTENT